MSSRTIDLSRLTGLFTVMVVASMLVARLQAMDTMRSLVQDRPALIIVGMLGTAAGLAIVLEFVSSVTPRGARGRAPRAGHAGQGRTASGRNARTQRARKRGRLILHHDGAAAEMVEEIEHDQRT